MGGSVAVGVAPAELGDVTPNLVSTAQKLVTQIGSHNQVELTTEWLSNIVKNDSTVLLLARASDGQVVGMAVLLVYPTLTNMRALLETLAVDPRHKRLGVASALIEHALILAGKSRVNTVRATTAKDNAAANSLMTKLGTHYSDENNWYDFVLSVGPQQ